MTSAESHLPAISKEERVRVESSKNMLITVRPRSAGSFLTSRFCTSCMSGGGLEDLLDLVGGDVVDREQVLHEMVTSSRSSDSVSRTLTRSERALGRFLPTWSARIGSSRWPRSTSTARRTALGRPRSASASSAARIVRPENSTSSTSTTILSSIPPGGITVLWARRGGLLAQVVAIHGDVELTDGHRGPLDGLDALGDPVGQRHPAGVQAEEDEIGGALVALEDLVGDAGQRPGDVTGVEHDARVGRLVCHGR